MDIIVGGVIKKDNKYLLVRENKEKYCGMYNIPAGHLEKNELLIDGAKREIKEETGYDVIINGIVQIGNTEKFVSVIFYGEVDSEQDKYNTEEISMVKWCTYEEIIEMEDKLRSSELLLEAIKSVENNNIYPIEIII